MGNTSNMNLIISVPGTTSGPQWADNIESNWLTVDAHGHIPGQGVPIVTAAISINAPLSFNDFDVVSARTLNFEAQASTPANLGDVGCLFENSAGDLQYINALGQLVPITLGDALDASSIGSITGMGGTGAAVTYDGTSTFAFTSAANTPAALSTGPVSIGQLGVVSPKLISLKSPNSLSSNYSITLPSALPGATQFMTMSSAGVVAVTATPTIASGLILGTSLVTGTSVAAGTTVAATTTITAGTGITSTTGDIVATAGSGRFNHGVEIPYDNTEPASPTFGALLWSDTKSEAIMYDIGGGPRLTVMESAGVPWGGFTPTAFSTVEHVLAGGSVITSAGKTPYCEPNVLSLGSLLRATVMFRCTSSNVDAVTFNLRAGSAGTTADPVVGHLTVNSTGTGSNITCRMVFEAMLSAGGSSAQILNMLATYHQVTAPFGLQPALAGLCLGTEVTTFDATTGLYFTLSAVSAATSTTLTGLWSTFEVII